MSTQASAIVAEVEQRASGLISKAEKPLSKAEAYRAIFKQDPALYARYRAAVQTDVGAAAVVVTKADGSTAPTFGTELLRRQMDGLYELGSALMSTLAGIVSAESGDKGALVQQALAAFNSAVRGAFEAAGIPVPVAKQLIPPALEAQLLRTCLQLAPADPLGHDATILAKALRELRQGLAA